MATSTGLLARTGGGLATALSASVLLCGCGDGGGGRDAAASSSSSPAAGTSAPDLAGGLLPAESFGPDATVVALSLEQLRAGTGLAALGKDLTITPEACATAVQRTQPDLDAFDDVAGVSATTGPSATVEILLRGGPTEGAVDQMAQAVRRCPHAQVTSPELGTVTVDFATLPVADLGDGAAAMRYTTSVTTPDGAHVTVPVLVGAVEDGDRLVVLISLADPTGGAAAGGSVTPAPAPLDPAAFTDLLQQAYQVEADALG
jgi:hypothetical protein